MLIFKTTSTIQTEIYSRRLSSSPQIPNPCPFPLKPPLSPPNSPNAQTKDRRPMLLVFERNPDTPQIRYYSDTARDKDDGGWQLQGWCTRSEMTATSKLRNLQPSEPRSIKSSLLSRSRDYCKCYTSTTFYVTMWMRMILLYCDVVGRVMTLMQVAYAYLGLTVLGCLSLEHM